jgi:glucose-6-phosphate isomerase
MPSDTTETTQKGAPNAPLIAPSLLTIHGDGALTGHTSSYEKHLSDMTGVYADDEALAQLVQTLGGDTVVYTVESQQYEASSGALIVGTSRLLPGKVGSEFAVTRGHLHAIADRAELYYCLSGRGVMLLETVDGRSQSVELVPGQATNVPGGWIHRSINVSDEPFVTLFCYAADAGQDYRIIADAGGMSLRIVDDGAGGWVEETNSSHIGYRRTAPSQ